MKPHINFLFVFAFIGIALYMLYRMSRIEPFVPRINEIVNKNKRQLRVTKEKFTNMGYHYLKLLFRKIGLTSM